MDLKRNHPYLADAIRAGIETGRKHIHGKTFEYHGEEISGACALGLAYIGEGVVVAGWSRLHELSRAYPVLYREVSEGMTLQELIVAWNDIDMLPIDEIVSRTLEFEKRSESNGV